MNARDINSRRRWSFSSSSSSWMMPKYGLIIFLVATFGLTTTTMFSVQLLLPPLLQEAYANEYTVSDEASCLALPPGSGSLSWEDPSEICEIDYDTWTIAAGDTLTISSGVTLLMADGGTIDNIGGTINNNIGGTISNGGNIINKCGGTINNNGTISGNPVVNEPCKPGEPKELREPEEFT
jgi:hypothetical protein